FCVFESLLLPSSLPTGGVGRPRCAEGAAFAGRPVPPVGVGRPVRSPPLPLAAATRGPLFPSAGWGRACAWGPGFAPVAWGFTGVGRRCSTSLFTVDGPLRGAAFFGCGRCGVPVCPAGFSAGFIFGFPFSGAGAAVFVSGTFFVFAAAGTGFPAGFTG